MNGFSGLASFPWYGTMYLLSLATIWFLVRRHPITVAGGRAIESQDIDNIVVWAMVGAVAGGRLGYVLLYEPGYYFSHLLEVPQLWRGGMSFHGGVLGLVLSVRLSASAKAFWPVLDRLALWIPLGLFFGRLGNFLLGELWGRPSNLPWAIVFPGGGEVTRHPSQLYEAFGEGLLLLLLLHLYARRAPAPGKIAALLGIAYALVRVVIEFFREPDPAWGYLAWGWLTWGQVLSLVLLACGVVIFIRRK